MNTEILAITYGLSSALSWGAGDFSGGIASKRGNLFTVILFSQVTGFVVLAALALAFAETIPPVSSLVFGGLAGLSGLLGIIALYRGLAMGRMGVVAPVSAVMTAAVPVVFALLTEGLPGNTQLAGFGFALVSVWFLSGATRDTGVRLNELFLPLAAGLGFGLFFVFIGHGSCDSVFWPLVAARTASISATLLFLFLSGKGGIPGREQLPHIAAAGILDSAGNAFFVLAVQVGRLDISAVLASLYPAATVLLAWIILKERLARLQWAGVLIAAVALALIAA